MTAFLYILLGIVLSQSLEYWRQVRASRPVESVPGDRTVVVLRERRAVRSMRLVRRRA